MSDAKSQFLNFVQDVNLLMTARAGVSYAEVMRSIHPGLEAPRMAFENGVAPSAFVDAVMEAESFMPVGEHATTEEAKSYNTAVAALAGFAFGNRAEWHRTIDAVYYSALDEDATTILRLRPVFNSGLNAYGFGVELREGARMNAQRTTFDDMGEVVGRFPGPDIAEAVAMARDNLRLNETYAFD